MTPVILLLLAAAWAAMLLPPAIRSRGGLRRDSMVSFGSQLAPMERPSHKPVDAMRRATAPSIPTSAAEAERRRFTIGCSLGGFALLTLLGALFVSPMLLFVNIIADGALFGFLFLAARQRADARRPVAPVHTLGARPIIAGDLRRAN